MCVVLCMILVASPVLANPPQPGWWVKTEGNENPEWTNIYDDVSSMVGQPGPKGDKGDTGNDGADGYTPIKGVDYFTQDDIETLGLATEQYVDEIVGDIDALLGELTTGGGV